MPDRLPFLVFEITENPEKIDRLKPASRSEQISAKDSTESIVAHDDPAGGTE